MMDAKELITLNNEKRELLNAENEAYYDNVLIYIRMQVGISEQQTEELVMELLDHLLEAQEAGKSAEEVFGDNPKAYCNEMIAQLPKEKGKKKINYVIFLITQLIGFMAIGAGAVNFIAGFFTDTTITIHLGSTVLIWIIDISLVLIAVALLLYWIRRTVFSKTSKLRDGIFCGVLGILLFSGFIFFPRWIPTFGKSFEIPGVVPLIIGALLLIVTYLVNKRYRIV